MKTREAGARSRENRLRSARPWGTVFVMARRDTLVLALLFLGCAHREPPRSEAAQGAVELPSSTSETGWRLPPGAYLGERNRCIDRELASRELNEYGDPPGTTYPEGRPLGVTQTTDRFEYVLQRHPGIRTTCTRTGFEPGR